MSAPHVVSIVQSLVTAMTACRQFLVVCRRQLQDGGIKDEGPVVKALSLILEAHKDIPHWILPNDGRPPECLKFQASLALLRAQSQSRHRAIRAAYGEKLERAHAHLKSVAHGLVQGGNRPWNTALESIIYVFQPYASGTPGLEGGASADEPHIIAAAQVLYLEAHPLSANVEAVMKAAATFVDDGVISNAFNIGRLCVALEETTALEAMGHPMEELERGMGIFASHLATLIQAAG